MTRFSEEWYSERLAKQGTAAKAEKVKAPKPAKYGNRKVTVDNITFDSAKESRRYKELKLLEDAGHIKYLQVQKPFILVPPVVLNGRTKPAVKYLCDFYYWRNGVEVVEDVKSAATRKLPVYRLKAHLLKYRTGLDISEI